MTTPGGEAGEAGPSGRVRLMRPHLGPAMLLVALPVLVEHHVMPAIEALVGLPALVEPRRRPTRDGTGK